MAEFVYKQEQWVPCLSPLRGWFGKDVNPATGRRPIVFRKQDSFSGVPLELPCGQCVGCRLERSRQWAVRIMHEKKMHAESAFLTLTYDDLSLPPTGSLVVRDLQLFMKRLRKQRPQGLRFFACGEYGEERKRPHYHVLLLNTCFADQKFWKVSKAGFRLFVSAELSKLWTFGDHYIGSVTFESCAYVARYCVKKVTGKKSLEHYAGRAPEFTCMSRRPGIGFPWFERYGEEAFARDSCVINGKEVGLPRYYDSKYKEVDDEWLRLLKDERRRTAIVAGRADRGSGRRLVLEKLMNAKLDMYRREI